VPALTKRLAVLLVLVLPPLAGAVAAVAFGGGGGGASDSGAGAAGAGLDARTAVQGHSHKHAGAAGHLPATRSNVELVSTLGLRIAPGKKIADVAVHDGYAYLGAWGGTCRRNGVHVVDIRNPARPRKAAFVAARRGSYPGEGVQALHLDTAAFEGDVLVTNNETCDRTRRLGGLNLYDVSNPRRPKVLVEGFGDRSSARNPREKVAHEIHSVFAWDAGARGYAVLVDNRERHDVDIVDLTNPKKPRLVAEYDLLQRFPRIAQGRPDSLGEIFHHDVVVKRIGSRQVMLVSYWDGGYVKLDVTDPRNARYLADSDFPNPDAELAAQSGLRERPEGNGHQSEFTRSNEYVIAADEDFGPTGLDAASDDGGPFAAIPGDRSRDLALGDRLSGRTRYVGRACDADAPIPAAADAAFAVVSRGVCPFTAKLANVQGKGYAAALVVNNEGAEGCGLFRMAVSAAIPAFAVARQVGFGLFDRTAFDERACRAGSSDLLPGVEVGAEGDTVAVRSYFDGWGYVHLFRNRNGKLEQRDSYAIREAMDPAHANGFGTLSVHEVATSHARNDLAYFSYYAGGLRVAKIADGKLVEVGRFIDTRGNNFWGVQVFEHEGNEYVAASDIDFGLYVFRYTGD
jgi:LVIVD repeat